MTTARDLVFLALEPSGRTVERGDLSLALAGAETIDLLGAGVIALDGTRIVPETSGAAGDRLLTEAAHQVRREEPYEDVTDWLWRRGRGLADVYLTELETQGEVRREERRRWGVLRTSEPVLADTAARRRATARRDTDEPVLAALAAAIGLAPWADGSPAGPADGEAYEPAPGDRELPEVPDRWAATVLDRLTDALAELAAERERRAHKLDDATVDNYRRGY